MLGSERILIPDNLKEEYLVLIEKGMLLENLRHELQKEELWCVGILLEVWIKEQRNDVRHQVRDRKYGKHLQDVLPYKAAVIRLAVVR